MNERIKELYNQCFIVLENDTIDVGFDIEKFAELIVQQCINRAERYGLGCDAVEQLNRYFGVEE